MRQSCQRSLDSLVLKRFFWSLPLIWELSSLRRLSVWAHFCGWLTWQNWDAVRVFCPCSKVDVGVKIHIYVSCSKIFEILILAISFFNLTSLEVVLNEFLLFLRNPSPCYYLRFSEVLCLLFPSPLLQVNIVQKLRILLVLNIVRLLLIQSDILIR